MALTNNEFETLIQNNLQSYAKAEPEITKRILRALPKWRKSKTDWLLWWKQQNLNFRIDLLNFLFWLVRQEKFSINTYGEVHDELIPIQVSSTTIPVSMVESDGTPVFEGGIVEQEWNLCNYTFKSIDNAGKWNVSFQVLPDDIKPTADLDLVLSALSFEVRRKQRIAKIGFIPHHFQASTHTQTEAIMTGMGVTVHGLPFIEPTEVEQLIKISKASNTNGLSVEELLRVRHRAITDSSNESKLMTLWGSIEIELGDEEKSEKLLSKEEIDKLKTVLKKISNDESKRAKIIDQASKLKKKTKNDVIKAEVKKLRCSERKDVDLEIQQIFKMRGQLAHGKAIDKSQRLELLREVTFLFALVDELIDNKITEAIRIKSK